MEVPLQDIDSCVTLAKQCKLYKLIAQVEERLKQLYEFGKMFLHTPIPVVLNKPSLNQINNGVFENHLI